DGLLNKQIADRLGIQERTVKAHLTAIFERLDVRNRTQAGVVLRELAINAAKHAAGAEIVVTCLTYSSTVRVRVRDFGNGFDVSETNRFMNGSPGYGLLSVDQQVRGIGGTFELVSELEEGTRATVTVPLERRERESDGE
ncbi:MAG: sensor histidine kinase, partial [Phycisphaerales bacterium]